MTRPDATSERTLVLTQRVAAPRDVVFDFLINPEKLLRWMGTTVDIDPHPGGKFWMDVNGNDVASGSYIHVDPPDRVVFSWGWVGSESVPPGSTTVTITLTADGTDTVVELRHDGLPEGSSSSHAEGWGHFLPLLTAVAEDAIADHHTSGPS